MPLCLGLVDDDKRPLVLDKLVQKIAATDNHVGTGFVATPMLLTGLSDLGQGELAYTMANQRTFPSWYDMVFNHGTKIFKEDWKGGAVQMPPLGGGLGYWFYYSLAGIRPDPDGPGFKKIIIKPDMVSGLTEASGEYRSVYGLIRSQWKREQNQLVLKIEIPANTTARVYIPTKDSASITESGKAADKSETVKFLRMEGKMAVYEIGSGHYEFKTTNPL